MLIGYKVVVDKLNLVVDRIKGLGIERTSARALPKRKSLTL